MKSDCTRWLSLEETPLLQKYLDQETPRRIQVRGNAAFLQNRKLAFFCSQRCPGSVLAKMYDLAQILSQRPVTLMGGFQSPVEVEFLHRLLKSARSAIICPAKNLSAMRLKPEWQEPMQQGRLLLLSLFTEETHRIDRHLALRRNRFVAAWADEIFIAYAAPDGALSELSREIKTWKKKIYTIQDHSNEPLRALGAVPLQPAEILTNL
jgi:predicted Rossmann fold nucleotide-binding protein DprA/Smf involved in DNA uptake